MLRGIARLILRLGGWTAVGEVPDVPKAVMIAAPHTSNWDGLWALTYKVAMDIEVHFFAKEALFWFPLGNLLRGLGGIPLDRARATKAVQHAVEMFDANETFYFGLAPEGTRSKRDSWKSGFYRIATGAGVPIFLCVLDYGNKRVGIGKRLDPSGDIHADAAIMAEFYKNIRGRWPDKETPLRFR